MDAIEEAREIISHRPGRRSGRTWAMLESIKPGPPRTAIVVHDRNMVTYLKALIHDRFPELTPWVNIYTVRQTDRLHGHERLKVDHAVIERRYSREYERDFAALAEQAHRIALKEHREMTVTSDELRAIAREHIKFPACVPEGLRHYFFALELCGETGEVANQLKKQWRGDPGEFRQRAISELRDAQCIILFLAEMLGDDVLAGAKTNMLDFEQTDKWRRMVADAARLANDSR